MYSRRKAQDMKWSDVIGQADAKARLGQMLAGGRVPHALMLAGPTGHGTLALAIALASALLCERAGGARHRAAQPSMFGDDDDAEPLTEACGECPQCRMLTHFQHPDLHFSFPIVRLPSMPSDYKPTSDDFMAEWYAALDEEGPYLTLESWMRRIKATTQQPIIPAAESDALARKLTLAASQRGYKVAVVWLAERMNDDSANKILKTLEEPTPDTVFILAVERPELLLETIRSRVQRIDVPSISADDLTAALSQKRGIVPSAARGIARASAGNWTTATELLSPDAEQHIFLDQFITLMRHVYKRDVREMKKWSETVAAFGREKEKRLLTYFMRMVREAFISNFHEPQLSYMTAEEEKFIANFGRFVNESNVIEINALLELAVRDIAQNTNQKIVLFDTALRLTVLLLRK